MADITVLIADDHPLFRKGLRQMIEDDEGVRVVAEAANGAEVLEHIQRHTPDVVVMDIEMPQTDGLTALRAIRESNLATSVIVLTMHKDEAMLREAFALGARGYVLKASAAAEVLDAVRAVAMGNSYVSPALASMLIAPATGGLALLTPTERRILEGLANFRTSKEIAEELSISFRTVETHRNNICVKLGLEGKHALLRFAAEHKGKF